MNRSHAVIGGFEAFLHPNDALIWLNYAFPTSEPEAGDLKALKDHFRENDRIPRLEFFPDLWPTLEPMLIESGFTVEMRAPLMVMTREGFVPQDPGRVEMVVDEAGYRAYCDAAGEAFGMEEPPSDDSVSRSVASIQAGHQRYAGIYEGDRMVAGAGTVGAGPIVELVGVGTRLSHRRRGLASVASSVLCTAHFEGGGDLVWLSAGTDASRKVYAKLGFQLIGEQWNYSIQPD